MRNSFGHYINIDCRGSFQLALHVTIIILHKQEFVKSASNEQLSQDKHKTSDTTNNRPKVEHCRPRGEESLDKQDAAIATDNL